MCAWCVSFCDYEIIHWFLFIPNFFFIIVSQKKKEKNSIRDYYVEYVSHNVPLYRQQYIPFQPRGGEYRRGRGGYHNNQRGTPTGDNNGDSAQQQQPQRVPPPTYVCYRCGQKGECVKIYIY